VPQAAEGLLRTVTEGVAAAGADLVELSAQVSREDVELSTSQGVSASYRATRLHAHVVVVAHGQQIATTRRGRRTTDLALKGALAAAVQHAAARAHAAPAAPGRYDLLVPAELLAAGPDFGWFEPLVVQADGARCRLGLSRHVPGQPVVQERGALLSLDSDGTVPFGWHSAPFGRLGEPVRRFPIIALGRAADVALDAREAGLRQVAANGGIRNLVVAGGGSPADLERASPRPTLELTCLGELDIDGHSGDFAVGLELAYLDDKPITGGVLHGNLYRALEGLALSSTRVDHSWYRGPDRIRLDDVALS
jgi:predicted Zn-dependent protease